MGDLKIRHLVPRKGKRGTRYYFQATPPMRRAGIHSEALGSDPVKAAERAEALNERWDETREEIADLPPPTGKAGTFGWLIDRFQGDPTYYLSKGVRTREEADYVLGKIVRPTFGDIPVKSIQRKHCRAFHKKVLGESTEARARKAHKWLSRLLSFALEEGLIPSNPAVRMGIKGGGRRTVVWTPGEIEDFKRTITERGRRSLALTVQLAYDSSQRQADILALAWPQFDGAGLTFQQAKTGKSIWCPLSPESLAMLAETPKTSTHIIVSEETGRPYTDRNVFSRMIRRFRVRTGIKRDVTFHDLRRTAMTEMGNRGATEAEIISISGHEFGSPAIRHYVHPGREAALRGAAKRRKENDV